MQIHFFSENVDFKLEEKIKIKNWIKKIILQEKKNLDTLNYIFCDDAYLLEINQEYLDHDTYTDIITFDNGESDKDIEGDIFISIERVRENAFNLNIGFQQELKRVIIHGVLHLLGYKDKTEKEQKTMRQKEDDALKEF
jgi:probable rRNA maturation factor